MREPTLSDYARIVLRRWWILAICGVVGLGAGYAYAHSQSKLYAGSTDIIVNLNTPSNLSSSEPISAKDPERWITTQVQFAQNPSIALNTLRRLHLHESVAALQRSVDVTADPNSDTLTVTAHAPTADKAIRIADEYAKQFIAYRINLDQAGVAAAQAKIAGQLATARKRLDAAGPDAAPSLRQEVGVLTGQLQGLQTLSTFNQKRWVQVTATDSSSQVRPKTGQTMLLGLAGGLLFGMLLIVILHSIDTRVREGRQVTAATGMPLLAAIPSPKRRRKGLALLEDPASPNAQGYHKLATAIDFANLPVGARTVMLTSAIASEGKSTTAANLALTYASLGRRVALVDLDLRRPRLGKLLGVEPRRTIVDVVRDVASLDDVAVRVPLPPSSLFSGNADGALLFLAAGSTGPDPAPFLASPALRSVLMQVADAVDLVIVDTPPLLPVGDAIATAGLVDAAILLARAGTVKRPLLEEAARILATSPASVLGCVLTQAESDSSYVQYTSYKSDGSSGDHQPTVPARARASADDGD